MNCRQGDIAMVATLAGYSGPQREVACQLLGIPVRLVQAYLFHGEPAWRLERNVHIYALGVHCEVQGIVDAILRPIRGGEGDDEIVAEIGREIPA